MRVMLPALLAAGLCLCSARVFAQAQNACDLNKDGSVNVVDGQLAVNMALGLNPCTANIAGSGLCNSDVASRVVAAALGGSCNTHYVSLSWTASTSGNIAGYNIYRASTSGGPYTKMNASLIVGTSYTDTSAVPGKTYYYVSTAVDKTNAESSYSNQTSAAVPTT
jgi:hypothetical protein